MIDKTQMVASTEANDERISDVLVGFLEHLAVYPLFDRAFLEVLGTGNGQDKYRQLVKSCGFASESDFRKELLSRLNESDGTGEVVLGGLTVPYLLLMAVLEVLMPGDQLVSVKSLEQLEKITNIVIDDAERADLQKVIETYPVRLSMHIIRQVRLSRMVAYQYLPFSSELDDAGHTNTWIGQFHQGLLEQMYRNRAIFLVNMRCPVYCRFCFRKHKESRNQDSPTRADVQTAIEHVKDSPAVKEVLISGGDPFLHRENLAAAIDGLMEVEHVQTLRLATRSISYYPQLFLGDNGRVLTYLIRKNRELQHHNKRLEMATHFIHPDEISPQSLEIITTLVNNGITVYVQTPFLKNCNDRGPELARLFSLLRGAGAELHYIFIPCSPIHGNSIYRTPISKGIEVGNYLRAHLSDRITPRICTATPIGKIDWNSSGWTVEPVQEKKGFIWIRSPYTVEYFKDFASVVDNLDSIRVNDEGTIDIQYMADIGDDSLFLGNRPPNPGNRRNIYNSKERYLPLFRKAEKLSPSLADTGSAKVARVHETRVEVDAGCGKSELQYIASDERITDVVILVKGNLVESLPMLSEMIMFLRKIHHVNGIRLRNSTFTCEPQRFTEVVIQQLADMNRLTIDTPQRIELETGFLLPDEFSDEHGRITRLVNNVGITVYNNTPLLGGINDTPEIIQEIAYNCRRAGIEFHHLYVAGLDVQNSWNKDNPIALHDIVDIASRVRREGSGREVPNYIIRTPLGEVDFGLSSRIVAAGEKLRVKLLPYSLEYYRSISANFIWPEGVFADSDSIPVVEVIGLVKNTDFALC